jgi:hypothetical protein
LLNIGFLLENVIKNRKFLYDVAFKKGQQQQQLSTKQRTSLFLDFLVAQGREVTGQDRFEVLSDPKHMDALVHRWNGLLDIEKLTNDHLEKLSRGQLVTMYTQLIKPNNSSRIQRLKAMHEYIDQTLLGGHLVRYYNESMTVLHHKLQVIVKDTVAVQKKIDEGKNCRRLLESAIGEADAASKAVEKLLQDFKNGTAIVSSQQFGKQYNALREMERFKSNKRDSAIELFRSVEKEQEQIIQRITENFESVQTLCSQHDDLLQKDIRQSIAWIKDQFSMDVKEELEEEVRSAR